MLSTNDVRAESVLIAEDDPMIHDLLITRLEVGGYRTFGARDGFEAIKRLESLRPDMLVLDINMPGIDGFEVLRRKAANRALSAIPTLVLTARGGQQDVARALAVGASDYLVKPFDDQVLLRRLQRLVRLKARARARGTDLGA